jgi:hypothetical protein
MLPSSFFHSKPWPQNNIQTSSSNHPLNEIEKPNPISEMGPNQKELRVRIFILDFAYISRKFPSDSSFFPENKEIYTPPLCGLEYIYFTRIGQPKLSERKS